jgi:VWFA-related protein
MNNRLAFAYEPTYTLQLKTGGCAMKLSVAVVLLIALISLPGGFTVGQNQSPQQPDEVLRIRTNEVRLDIVVKDKKGRPIKDLTTGDFEIYEDGVQQRIQSFRFVTPEATAVSNADRARSGKDKPTESSSVAGGQKSSLRVTALVFDRLSLEARTLARRAGMTYAQEGMAGGDFTAVFGIDQSLRTCQSFTDNSELVKQAIERATSTSPSTYASSAGKIRDLADRSNVLDQQVSSSESAAQAAGAARDSAGASAAGSGAGQAAAEQLFNQMQTNILEQFEGLERDQQGFATINSLLAVINPMKNLPGRKTVIFFSEGLALPSSVQTKFPAVISAANRANVSIYTIDAAGLRTESGTAEAARELNSIASQRMQQQSRGNDQGISGPYMKSLERNENLLRLDPRSGLQELADQTGGFLIHDTNDLANGLRRINDDMRGYYLITYLPQNEDYNGRFRRISVKLSRPNVEVQTRKGYYAVEAVGQLPVLDYEAPAIAAARSARGELNPLSFRAAALSFPAANRPGLTLLLGEAPMSAFNFAPAADKKSYNADFSVVALIRDQSGQVVQKLSRHYPLGGPIEQLDAARKGEWLFYRETQLPPGSYRVELIAYDGLTGQTSVRTSPLEIASIDQTKPRLSSVAVLKRAERLTAEEQKRDEPFHFGELLVYPNLGEPISKSRAKQLAFFLTAWPARGSTTALQLTFEILQAGRPLGKSSAQLPAADDQGQIKYASSFPLNEFQPGIYELKVTVGDGKNRVSRSTRFTVAP